MRAAGRGDAEGGGSEELTRAGDDGQDEDDIKRVGSRARSLRLIKSMTQETVASRASIHETSLGRVERGERNATFVLLVRIAWGLEIDPQVLVDGPADAHDLLPEGGEPPRRGRAAAGNLPGRPRDRELDAELVRRLGARLRRLRAARKLTQQELAARAGLHWSFIGQAERGERNITYGSIVQLARGLGCPPAELFADLGELGP